ncbi:hypothetical protein [Dyella sp.]|jgi:hypothetical protein|uniref:hypothetical protein n=1 Tax=Dyella sp. TaxID=1869338 RepID=UPI002D791ABD|nr:hypothetical protein [Dyella sp.]HET6431416.1 hypothetical protein [Dyella sp.]
MRSFLFRLIGILEIAGGFLGVVASVRRLLPLGSTASALMALISLAVFGFILVAGVLLVEGSERGVSLSRVAQLLQLPLLATPALSYALHAGGFVNVFAIVHGSVQLGLDYRIGSHGFVLAVAGPAVWHIGLNLLALLSWLVLRLR